MRMKDVDARRAYVQKIRQSFDAPSRQYEFEKEELKKGEAEDNFSFFKARLLIAMFLFAAYILCDRTNTSFYGYSTKEIVKEIAQNFDYLSVKDEVAEVFQTIRIR